MATSEFAILTLVSFLYFAWSGRASFSREIYPRINEFRGLPKGRLWFLLAVLCEMMNDLGFISIVESGRELDPVLAYRALFLFQAIDLEGLTMYASYFPYASSEGALISLPATEMSVARFGDGGNGERIRTGYDYRSFPAVDYFFLRDFGRTDVEWCNRAYDDHLQTLSDGQDVDRYVVRPPLSYFAPPPVLTYGRK